MAGALMVFLDPSGFWLGLAAAGVLAAHLVRRRARRAPVPFLPLWEAVVAQSRGGFGARIVRHLDLLLGLVACAAVTVAAARPTVPGRPDRVRDLVLVLDGGVELRAGSRLDRLRRVAAAEVERRAAGTRFVVVSVDPRGTEVHRAADAAGALAVIAAHDPGWLRASSAEALALGREAGRALRRPDLVFCTHRPGDAPGYRLRTVREASPNAGVVGLELLRDPEGGGRLARVRLRADGDVTIDEVWSGTVAGERTVDLPLPESGRVDWRVRAPGDGFPHDDGIRLILPERIAPRLLVVAAGEPSPFLVTALQALAGVGAVASTLDRTTPERAAEAAPAYDLLLFDRCAPPSPLRDVRSIYLAPPPAALPFKVGEEIDAPAFFAVDGDDAILRGVDLARIPPRRARAIYGGRVLATAAPGPVLCAGPDWIAVGVDPDRCVWAASPAYPLFLRNCVRALARAAPAEEPEFRRVGGRAPGAGVARTETGARVRVDATLVGPPGFWSLGDVTFAVNLVDPGVDLAPATRASDALPDVGTSATTDRSLVAHFAALALVAMLLVWWRTERAHASRGAPSHASSRAS